MDDRTRLLLAEKQLKQPGVLKRLADYALRYDDFTGRRLPPDWEPSDVVNEAICLLLSGVRTWDCERFPDVTVALRGIIKSLFYHLPRLKYNETRIRPVGKDGVPLNIDELNVGQVAEQEMMLVDKELRQKIESIIGDDEELMSVYLAMLEGYTKPREISRYLGLEVREINKILQRLRRTCFRNIRTEPSS